MVEIFLCGVMIFVATLLKLFVWEVQKSVGDNFTRRRYALAPVTRCTVLRILLN